MPTYVYGCGAHGNFEEAGSLEDSLHPCPVCHEPARRRPYSSIPYLKGSTVANSIPDPMYRQEAQKRELNASWGDASRAVDMLRKNSHEVDDGHKVIDLKGMQ